MGCINSKKYSVKNYMRKEDIDQSDNVTKSDLELIKQSWDSIENKEEIGITVMVLIFQENQEIKNKWIFAANLETEAEMVSNSQLRYHAKKIIEVFNGVIVRLISLEPGKNFDEEALIRLGQSHFHYNVNREHFAVNTQISLIFFYYSNQNKLIF